MQPPASADADPAPPTPRTRLSAAAPAFVPPAAVVTTAVAANAEPAAPASPAGGDTPPPGFDRRRGKGFEAADGRARVGNDDDGVPDLPPGLVGGGGGEQNAPSSTFTHTPPLCAVCTDPAFAVAVGPCNHKTTCAPCALRLRLCYRNTRCVLCQCDLDELVLARWRPALPDWGDYAAKLARLTTRPGWARGVYVDEVAAGASVAPPPRGSLLASVSPLSAALVALTARACPACPPTTGTRGFPSTKALHAHVAAAHAPRALCRICVDEGKAFTRDLPLYATPAALKTHVTDAHPACLLCGGRRFYSGDDLYAHVRAAHFTCHVCAAAGAHHAEATAAAMTAHMRRAHHHCDEPACEGAFAAFATRDELEAHARTVHGRSMPRFDRRAARVLPLDLVVRPGGAGRGENGGRGGRGGGVGPVAPPRGRAAPLPPPNNPSLRVIDDDEFPGARTGGARAVAAAADAFPALAASTPASTRPANAPPPIIRVTTRCPCGRRRSHVAVEQGTVVPALACDGECASAARAATLARAFDVDRTTHVAVFDRPGASTRTDEYGPDLLHFAWHNRDTVAAMESLLADFVADVTAARRSAPPAPESVRKILHGLAPFYGLASQSFGAGPRRHVELFKAGRKAAVPAVLLSAAAARLTRADVDRAGAQAAGYPLVLCDVAPGADLLTLLQRFQGDFALEPGATHGTTIARFRSAPRLRAALDTLGGGMRGAFRVDRKATLQANQGNGAFESGGGGVAQANAPAPPAAPAPRPTAAANAARLRTVRPSAADAFEVTPPQDWGRAGDFDWASEV